MVKLWILVADGDKRLNVTHVTHTLGILKAKWYDYMYLPYRAISYTNCCNVTFDLSIFFLVFYVILKFLILCFVRFAFVCFYSFVVYFKLFSRQLVSIQISCKGHIILASSMVCNRSWHLPGNPSPVWHPARLVKERGCMDLSMDTLHLNDPMVLFGSEGSALTQPLFLLSSRIILFFYWQFDMEQYRPVGANL